MRYRVVSIESTLNWRCSQLSQTALWQHLRSVIIWVYQTHVFESGQMVLKKLKGTYFDAYLRNIARGTTDPGYWVYNLNHVSDWNQFANILAEKDHSSYGLNTLGPLCLWQCFKTFFSTFSYFFQLFFNFFHLFSTFFQPFFF